MLLSAANAGMRLRSRKTGRDIDAKAGLAGRRRIENESAFTKRETACGRKDRIKTANKGGKNEKKKSSSIEPFEQTPAEERSQYDPRRANNLCLRRACARKNFLCREPAFFGDEYRYGKFEAAQTARRFQSRKPPIDACKRGRDVARGDHAAGKRDRFGNAAADRRCRLQAGRERKS